MGSHGNGMTPQLPPVYRPRVAAQGKIGSHGNRTSPPKPPVYRPVAPAAPLVPPSQILRGPVQQKAAAGTGTGVSVPPAYRPGVGVQAKVGSQGNGRTAGPAPGSMPAAHARPTTPINLPTVPPVPGTQGSAHLRSAVTDVVQQRAVSTRNLPGGSPRGSIAPKVASRSTTIQREILRFDGGKWVLEKLGTKGTHKPPAQPDPNMVYFNTLTGVQGLAISDVEAGLADLMVIKGSLKDTQIGLQWDEQLWNDLHAATPEGGVNELGTIRLQKDRIPMLMGTTKSLWLLRRLWLLLLSTFMNKNGQTPYIYAQEWYKKRKAVVDISVNFYNNRSAQDRTFEFHKDTAGDNLFVNLIFNNRRPILATEWTVDTRRMKQKKKDRMNTYTGDDSVATAIEGDRERIRQGTYSPKGVDRIEGGVAKGEAAFVSWVDELVWHSSPFGGSRAGSPRMSIYRKPEKYYYSYGEAGGQDAADLLLIVKALRSLRSIEGTSISNFSKLHGGKQKGDDQIFDYIKTIVDETGQPEQEWAQHVGDIDRYLGQISLDYGEEQARDSSNDDEQITRRMQIAARPRRNSDASKFESLDAASATTEKRSFIRTWVQIHKVEQ